jgi:hypothetical protein
MSFIIKQDHTTWCNESLEEVDLLRAYLAGLKQHLMDEKERFRSEVEEVVLYEDEECANVVSFFRGISDETSALEDIFTQNFPNLLLRSALVSFYTFAEVTLDTLCDRFTRHLKSSVSVADMKDKGISRAKRYLTKLCGLDFGSLPPWAELKNIAEVRNLIVHANGCVSTNTRRELLLYIERSQFLRLDGQELILSLEYIDHFLDVIKNLIYGIGKQIQTQQQN